MTLHGLLYDIFIGTAALYFPFLITHTFEFFNFYAQFDMLVIV
jgi:hypothetical protein